MKKDLLRLAIVLIVLYYTPLGGFVRPLFTSKSGWFEGINVTSYGTGFYVNEWNVVTNHHVVAGCETIWVGGRDKRVSEAKVVADDAPDDLAVLQTETRVATPLYLSDGIGIELWKTVSYPDYTSGQGEFSLSHEAVEKMDEGNLYASVGLRFGNSGSPVMDEHGRVIGVNKGWRGEGILGFLNLTGYTVATHVSRLAGFLAKHRIDYTVVQGQQGDLLNTPNYRDFIAVNIGCTHVGPWFAR